MTVAVSWRHAVWRFWETKSQGEDGRARAMYANIVLRPRMTEESFWRISRLSCATAGTPSTAVLIWRCLDTTGIYFRFDVDGTTRSWSRRIEVTSFLTWRVAGDLATSSRPAIRGFGGDLKGKRGLRVEKGLAKRLESLDCPPISSSSSPGFHGRFSLWVFGDVGPVANILGLVWKG